MSVTGNENHDIILARAADFTKNFRDSAAAESIIGGYFGKTAIQDILDQTGCVGIRYYYAIDLDDNPTLVLVGVNSDGDDLVEGRLAEISWPCPAFCSASNALNTDPI